MSQETKSKGLGGKISHKIHQLRSDKGLSTSGLSEKTGVPEIFIQHIEAGARVPSVDELHKIASGLNVQLGELI